MRLEVELKSVYSNGKPYRFFDDVKKWRLSSYSGIQITFNDDKKEVITDILRVKEI